MPLPLKYESSTQNFLTVFPYKLDGKSKNGSVTIIEHGEEEDVSHGETAEEDPIKFHREGTALCDAGKYEEAIEKFLEAYKLYEKVQNFFDASYALFKAAECSYLLKDHSTATERFLKAADLAFKKGYDRFGLSALEYALDCYKAAGEEERAVELKKKIEEVRAKLSTL